MKTIAWFWRWCWQLFNGDFFFSRLCVAIWRMPWWTWTMWIRSPETTCLQCWPRYDRSSSTSCSRTPTVPWASALAASWWCFRVWSITRARRWADLLPSLPPSLPGRMVQLMSSQPLGHRSAVSSTVIDLTPNTAVHLLFCALQLIGSGVVVQTRTLACMLLSDYISPLFSGRCGFGSCICFLFSSLSSVCMQFEFQEAVDTRDYDIIHPGSHEDEPNVNAHSFSFADDLIVLPFLRYAHLFSVLKCHWMLQTDVIIADRAFTLALGHSYSLSKSDMLLQFLLSFYHGRKTMHRFLDFISASGPFLSTPMFFQLAGKYFKRLEWRNAHMRTYLAFFFFKRSFSSCLFVSCSTSTSLQGASFYSYMLLLLWFSVWDITRRRTQQGVFFCCFF